MSPPPQKKQNGKTRSCFEWNSPKWKSALSLHHRFFKGWLPSLCNSTFPHLEDNLQRSAFYGSWWRYPGWRRGFHVASIPEMGLEAFWIILSVGSWRYKTTCWLHRRFNHISHEQHGHQHNKVIESVCRASWVESPKKATRSMLHLAPRSPWETSLQDIHKG